MAKDFKKISRVILVNTNSLMKKIDYYQFSLLLLTFTIPFIGFHIPKYILGLCIILKIYKIRKRGFSKLNQGDVRSLVLLLLFPISLGITILYSEDKNEALKVFFRYSMCFIFPFLFLKERVYKRVQVIIPFICGVILLILINFLFVYFDLNKNIDHAYSQYSYMNLSSRVNLHPSYYSVFVSCAIYFSWEYLYNSYLKIIILILLGTTLILLSSKVILLITILYFILYFMKHIYSKRKNRILLSGLFIVFISILSILSTRSFMYERYKELYKSIDEIDTILKDGNNRLNENLVRLFLFKYSYETIVKDNKTVLFGYGIGDFEQALVDTYDENKYGFGVYYRYNSHNQYLSVILMSGLLGLLLYLLYLFSPFLLKKNQKFKEKKYIIVLLFVFGFVESYFNREVGILFGAYFISLYNLSSELE